MTTRPQLRMASSGQVKRRKHPTDEARARAETLRRELAEIGASTPEQLRTMGLAKLEGMWNRARAGEKRSGKLRRLFNGTSWIYGRG